MPPTLFDLPLDQIDYNIVKEFIEQAHPEGPRIDYKKKIPNSEKIAKTISAFANTHGGLLIIGVKTKRIDHAEFNVPEKLVGVEIKGGLESKFTNIALSRIFPPIAPEVKVIPFKSTGTLPEEDRTVVVIRIQESFNAPHELLRQYGIYVRINDQNRLASLQAIENLISRREKYETQREVLIKSYLNELSSMFPEFTITIVPLVPPKQLIKFTTEVDSFLRKKGPRIFELLNPFQRGARFWIPEDVENKRPSRSGLVTEEGLIHYREDMKYAQQQLNWEATLIKAYNLLIYAAEIYEMFNFYDRFLIRLELRNVNGFVLVPIDWAVQEYNLEGQGDVIIERTLHLYELDETYLDNLMKSILRELCRAFKWALEENNAYKMCQEAKTRLVRKFRSSTHK